MKNFNQNILYPVDHDKMGGSVEDSVNKKESQNKTNESSQSTERSDKFKFKNKNKNKKKFFDSKNNENKNKGKNMNKKKQKDYRSNGGDDVKNGSGKNTSVESVSVGADENHYISTQDPDLQDSTLSQIPTNESNYTVNVGNFKEVEGGLISTDQLFGNISNQPKDSFQSNFSDSKTRVSKYRDLVRVKKKELVNPAKTSNFSGTYQDHQIQNDYLHHIGELRNHQSNNRDLGVKHKMPKFINVMKHFNLDGYIRNDHINNAGMPAYDQTNERWSNTSYSQQSQKDPGTINTWAYFTQDKQALAKALPDIQLNELMYNSRQNRANMVDHTNQPVNGKTVEWECVNNEFTYNHFDYNNPVLNDYNYDISTIRKINSYRVMNGNFNELYLKGNYPYPVQFISNTWHIFRGIIQKYVRFGTFLRLMLYCLKQNLSHAKILTSKLGLIDSTLKHFASILPTTNVKQAIQHLTEIATLLPYDKIVVQDFIDGHKIFTLTPHLDPHHMNNPWVIESSTLYFDSPELVVLNQSDNEDLSFPVHPAIAMGYARDHTNQTVIPIVISDLFAEVLSIFNVFDDISGYDNSNAGNNRGYDTYFNKDLINSNLQITNSRTFSDEGGRKCLYSITISPYRMTSFSYNFFRSISNNEGLDLLSGIIRSLKVSESFLNAIKLSLDGTDFAINECDQINLEEFPDLPAPKNDLIDNSYFLNWFAGYNNQILNTYTDQAFQHQDFIPHQQVLLSKHGAYSWLPLANFFHRNALSNDNNTPSLTLKGASIGYHVNQQDVENMEVIVEKNLTNNLTSVSGSFIIRTSLTTYQRPTGMSLNLCTFLPVVSSYPRFYLGYNPGVTVSGDDYVFENHNSGLNKHSRLIYSLVSFEGSFGDQNFCERLNNLPSVPVINGMYHDIYVFSEAMDAYLLGLNHVDKLKVLNDNFGYPGVAALPYSMFVNTIINLTYNQQQLHMNLWYNSDVIRVQVPLEFRREHWFAANYLLNAPSSDDSVSKLHVQLYYRIKN